MLDVIQFSGLFLTSLSMSVHFGTWLTEHPLRVTNSGPLFVEVHKGRDKVAAKVMPILGNAAIVMVAIGAFLVRGDTVPFALSIAATVLIGLDMAVTLRGNVPINQEMQRWDAAAPPAEWSALRDKWERFHTIRTVLIVAGFGLYLSAVVFF